MIPELLIHQKALRLHKRIFRSLKSEAQYLLGDPPESIRRYEREAQTDFHLREPLRPSSRKELISVVQAKDVTFIADFHTFDQAQKTALKIMQESFQPHQTWFIGLEMIPSQHQATLDAFQMGEISVEEFHERISYSEEWGFPWKNYSPIFAWARETQIRIVALNRPKSLFLGQKERDLHARDEWAAGIISDLFYDSIQKGIQAKMFVLYGEHHVGTRHLPIQLDTLSKSYLQKPLSWVAVHQNSDRLYWKLAENNKELDTEVVQLRKGAYCVFSSTPWAKLQSLVNWLEGGMTENKDETELDYLSMLRTYGHAVSEFLEIEPPSYEAISAYTLDQAGSLEAMTQSHKFPASDLRLIRFHLRNNQRIYIPRISVAYLGSPSQNGAAELAAIYLLRTKNLSQNIFTYERDDFFRLILESTFGFFGSLLIHPKRKCDVLKDHMTRLSNLEEGSQPAFPFEQNARRIAVHFLNHCLSADIAIQEEWFERKLGPPAMMGAKFIGRILGKQLHSAILTDSVHIQAVQEVFLARSDHSKGFYEQQLFDFIDLLTDDTYLD